MEIGDRIRQARKRAGLTQKELAAKSGIPAITIQQYERGVRRQPKPGQLAKIAQTLGLSIGYFFGSDEKDAHEAIFVDRAILIMNNLRDENRLPQEYEPYYALLLDGNLSLPEKISIANSLQLMTGVSIDYLFGYTNEPNAVLRSLPSEYADLTSSILEADDALLATVHEICGMDADVIASDLITGDILVTWNPKKIDIIKEFLLKNQSAIRALIAAKMQEMVEE